MCTYQTATLPISGSGKGAGGWFPLTDASVYLDHPVSAPAAHTLNVERLKSATPILSAFANDKKIRLVGGVYELKTGRVQLLG